MGAHETNSLREKCPYSKFLWSVFSRIRTEYGEIPVSLSIQSECGKRWIAKTPNKDTFNAVTLLRNVWLGLPHWNLSYPRSMLIHSLLGVLTQLISIKCFHLSNFQRISPRKVPQGKGLMLSILLKTSVPFQKQS